MSAAALSVVGLRCSLGGREVLHGVDLRLPAGRWSAIVGPNGAGKTTLLQALLGLVPAQGQRQAMDRDVSGLTPREWARQVAWLGQSEEAAHDLLARDVVMLGRLPYQAWWSSPTASDHAAVQEAMRRTACWDWRERPLGQLSGGERQRVLLARALAVQAPVWVMDEPLTHLDPPQQADWLELVRTHVGEGGTAITVLHELNMALHADDIVVMAAGALVHQGQSAQPATHRAIEQVFGQRVAVHRVAHTWVVLPVQNPAPGTRRIPSPQG